MMFSTSAHFNTSLFSISNVNSQAQHFFKTKHYIIILWGETSNKIILGMQRVWKLLKHQHCSLHFSSTLICLLLRSVHKQKILIKTKIYFLLTTRLPSTIASSKWGEWRRDTKSFLSVLLDFYVTYTWRILCFTYHVYWGGIPWFTKLNIVVSLSCTLTRKRIP